MAKYWISLRKVSGGAFSNDLDFGSTRYLAGPDGRAPTPDDQIGRIEWLRRIIAEFPADAKTGKIEGNILFFVHGFDNSVENVNERHDKLSAGLAANGFPCIVISYDWPSGQQTFAYLDDLDKAKTSAIQLVNAGVKLLLRAQDEECMIAVHALAHSMGAYVTREALDHADDGQSTRENWTLNQLVFISGDVDAADFSANNKETESTYDHCYRFTNFFSRFDQALQVSNVKRAGVAPRVGRVGLPADAPDKGVNVDCSDYFSSVYGADGGGTIWRTHSWYFDDPIFLQDLSITLRGAIDRVKIPTRKPGPGHMQELQRPAPA
jgi:pimeloyl-ACP methyl ester carboxylesterase